MSNEIPYEIIDLLGRISGHPVEPMVPIQKSITEIVNRGNKEMKEYVLMWPDWDIEWTGAALDRMIPILMSLHELLMEESRKRRAKAKLFGV